MAEEVKVDAPSGADDTGQTAGADKQVAEETPAEKGGVYVTKEEIESIIESKFGEFLNKFQIEQNAQTNKNGEEPEKNGEEPKKEVDNNEW